MGQHLNSYEIVTREKELAFIKFRKPHAHEGTGPIKPHRMEGFTQIDRNYNANSEEVQFVDERSARKYTTSYSPTIPYSFKRYSHLPIHDELRYIADHMMTGADAECDIFFVDMATTAGEGKRKAIKGTYSVVPSSSGDSKLMTYSGTFEQSSGDVTDCYVTLDVDDNGKAYAIDEIEEIVTEGA